MKRREFIKTSAVSLAILPCATVFKTSTAHAAGDEIVSLDNPTAKALGYVHDASKADSSKRVKKAGVEGSAQLCSNCSFVTGEVKEIAGQEGKWVGCQLFPGKLVNNDGWCNSWAKKA